MFGWREVFTSFSMTDLANACEVLDQKGIRCDYKTTSYFGRTNSCRRLYGMDINHAVRYSLYVKKRALNSARQLLNETMNG